MSAEYTSGAVDTLAELKTKNWRAWAVGGACSVAVRGSTSAGDWGAARVARYSSAVLGTADDIQLADAAGGGQWVFEDACKGAVDVRWAGAKGDGSTDDTTALKAAAAVIQARGAGTLVVPPGSYRVVGGNPGQVIFNFSNLSRFELKAAGAIFTSSDFSADFVSCTLTPTGIGRGVKVTVPSGHGCSVGSYINIKDVVGEQGYRGTWIVTSAPNSTECYFDQYSYFVPMPAAPATGSFHKSHIGNVLFRFKNCQNVALGDLCFSGTVQPRDVQYRLGWITLQTVTNTRFVDGHVRVAGAAYGLWCGDYNTHNGDGCEGYRLKVSATNVGYPLSLNGGGHSSVFEVVGEELHRGTYAAGVHDVNISLAVKNWDVAGILLTHQPYSGATMVGCSHVSVDFRDTGTTGTPVLHGVGSTRYMVMLADYGIAYASAHRSIRARVQAKNAPYTCPLTFLMSNSLHRIDGFTLSGYIDQSDLDPATELRQDFYIDLTAGSAGTVSGLAIRDYTVVPPTLGVGPYNATLRVAKLDDDVLIDNYISDQPRNFSFPVGTTFEAVPALLDFDAPSAEAFAEAAQGGGMALNSSIAVLTGSASIGTSDFTALWVGTVPPVGVDAALYSVSPTQTGPASGGFGVSVYAHDLVVRAYGASTAEYVEAKVPRWQYTHGGRAVSVALVRTSGGLRIFTDGHENAWDESTVGTGPAWTDSFGTTYAFVGKADILSGYTGRVMRFAIWSYDRSGEFPEVAMTGNGSGLVGPSGAGFVMDSGTNNGSFESGGLSGWTAAADPGASATTSADAYDGTVSCALIPGAGNDYVSVGQTVMTIGNAYTVKLYAKVSGGVSGAISVVGGAAGEHVLFLDSSWREFSISDVWTSTSFVIKRADGAGVSLLVDAVTIQQVGATFDYDWIAGVEDRVSGVMPGFSGITSTRAGVRAVGDPISATRGDADVTVYAGRDYPIQLFNSTLTVDRTFTPSISGARRGDRFRVVRYGGGAFLLNVLTTSLDTNQWVDVVFNGTAWTVSARGALTKGFAASEITSGIVAPARLGSGTPDATKFLRGDGAWSVIDGANIGTGTVAVARLGAGTPTAAKYLAGDGNWTTFAHTHPASDITGAFPSGVLLTYAVPGTPAASTGAFYVSTKGAVKFKWPDATTQQVLLDTFTGPVTGTTPGDTTDILIRGATASPPASATYHMVLRMDGVEYGPGNTSRDTKMLRTGAGTFTFTSNIVVPGTITLGGADLQTTLNAKVAAARNVSTQYSLTGGGDLSADRTHNLVGDVASPGNSKLYGTNGSGTRGWYDQGAPTSRSVATQHSLTGGGDLSADRTLNLVNDTASPGNNKLYGTDGSGTRGWYDQPAVSGWSPLLFATTGSTTVSAGTAAETTLLGSVRAGESKTIAANALGTGKTLEIEAWGVFSSGGSDWANSVMRMKVGTGLSVSFTLEEPDSFTPSDWWWKLEGRVTVVTAGASATILVTAVLWYRYAVVSGSVPMAMAIQGVVDSGALDTTGTNVVDITWDNATGGELDMTLRHAKALLI